MCPPRKPRAICRTLKTARDLPHARAPVRLRITSLAPFASVVPSRETRVKCGIRALRRFTVVSEVGQNFDRSFKTATAKPFRIRVHRITIHGALCSTLANIQMSNRHGTRAIRSRYRERCRCSIARSVAAQEFTIAARVFRTHIGRDFMRTGQLDARCFTLRTRAIDRVSADGGHNMCRNSRSR